MGQRKTTNERLPRIIGLDELGESGISEMAGRIYEAYDDKLLWPDAWPIYKRLWRADEEVGMVRLMWTSLSRHVSLEWKPNPRSETGDQEQVDFLNEVLDDVSGGSNQFLDTLVAYVPFMGWGWFEMVPALRRKGWVPPKDDGWRSNYDDEKIGLRHLAFRHPSTFYEWIMDENTRRVQGMVQETYEGKLIELPKSRAIHLRYGDLTNPEGLAALETMWRLARIKTNLSIIQGMGFEHSAGHAKFSHDGELTSADKTAVRAAARAMMSAQEGNYILLPNKLEADLIDVTFQAAKDLNDAMRYYSVLKLALLGAQWIAFSTLSGAGSLASHKDSTEMFMTVYNSMLAGFSTQTGQQMYRALAQANPDFFSQVQHPPILVASKVNKSVALDELSTFMGTAWALMSTSEADEIAVRKASGFLPEVPPTPEEVAETEEDDEEADEMVDGEDEPKPSEPAGEDGEGEDAPEPTPAALEQFVPPIGEQVPQINDDAQSLEDDFDALLDRLERVAKEKGIDIDQLLTAESTEGEDDEAGTA